MALAIITADQRRQTATVKGQIWGQAGVGKTSLLKTLDPASTPSFPASSFTVSNAS